MARYNWIPDLPDFDRLYIHNNDIVCSKTEPYSDLQLGFSPVESQGALGSCTGQAAAAVLEYNMKIEDPYHEDVSRLFIYYCERWLEGNIGRDSGAYIRNAVKALQKWGVCSERLWPYKIDKFAIKPPAEAFVDAEKRKISQYQKLFSLDEIRHALTHGRPVIFGFAVFDEFESLETQDTGVVKMPTRSSKHIGGHAVVAAGHDDKMGLIKFKNSYTRHWGENGYGYLPYGYFEEKLTSDHWVIFR